MTLNYDLRIPQGVTWSVSVPVLAADNTPVSNLAGYSAKAQVRDDAGDVLHEWSVAAGNMTLGSGEVVLEVSPATSAGWAWRFARFDLELTDPFGDVTRLVKGSVFVDAEVTR
jgi:hypothetical protein